MLSMFAFAASVIAEEPSPRRVFIAGDSTASDYGPERAPRQGWGQQLQSFLDPTAWQVRNHAQSGRSSRSFIEQGWLDGIDKTRAPASACTSTITTKSHVLSGRGRYILDGVVQDVTAGDASADAHWQHAFDPASW